MKRALCIGLAMALAACSINHRSGDFACDNQSDCASGRSCIEGFCVAGQVDAAIDTVDCPSQCTSCTTASKTCTIDCALNGGCRDQIACPAGWACNVLCSVENACTAGVNCQNSTSCKISCSARGSCRNVACGLGACSVDCSGRNSCSNVSCGSSCACGVTCGPLATCNTVTCKASPAQCTLIRGCTAAPTGCNTCL